MNDIHGDYSQDIGYQQADIADIVDAWTYRDYTRYQHQDLVLQAKNGIIKASDTFVQLRAMKSEIEESIKEIEPLVIDELTFLDDKEKLISLGFKITHIKGRTSFNYKECPMWNDTDNERKRIEKLVKVATQQNAEITDKETGEIIEPVSIENGKGYLKMEKYNG